MGKANAALPVAFQQTALQLNIFILKNDIIFWTSYYWTPDTGT